MDRPLVCASCFVAAPSGVPAAKGSKLGWFSKKKKEPEFVEPATKFQTSAELPAIDPMLSANTRTIVDTALAARAESLLFTLTAAGVQMHYIIDGVTHEAGVID